MNISLRSIFSHAWSCVFSNKKSFTIVFLYQFLPFLFFFFGAMILSVLITLLMPHYADYILAHMADPLILSGLAIAGWIFLLVLISIQLVCSYLSNLWLVLMFQKKKFSFRSLLKQWRGVGAWTGTGLIVALYFFGLVLVTIFLMASSYYVHEKLIIVPAILWFGVGVFGAIALSLSVSVYFFEGKKYFQAIKRSWELVRGRWWLTFGYAIVAITTVLIVSLLFNLIGISFSWISGHLPTEFSATHLFGTVIVIWGVAYTILQSAFNIVTQIVLTGFTFSLYLVYSENHIPKITAKKIPLKRKK